MNLRRIFFGKALDPFHPKAFQNIALIAFFAWIGLGADGLSSSCYGPEEAFIALGVHTHLALFVAIATAVTVFIISMGYNQVIELFPSGGGGYKVATDLLGKHAGLIAGAALIIDYVLTIAISIASGVDAVFSFLPDNYLAFKMPCEFSLVLLLMVLNLRGMKESIRVLLPIFVGFMITHVILIFYGVIAHAQGLPHVVHSAMKETHQMASLIGWFTVLGFILHAYSLGSGTYTGLEAVSNNVNRLAQPRIRTGKLTMIYMAVSLSFTAAGIILLYLLWNAAPVFGKTLNAVVFQNILGTTPFGHLVLIITLCFEAGILLVGANTGFLAGPGVLANMAVDRWVPRLFRHLSSRLVTQNGIILFGIAALLILLFSEGRVSWLVVLYSINVFITFSLTLLGLCIYWGKNRKQASANWVWRLFFSSLGFIIAASILIVTILMKFTEGGWVTIIITALVIVGCLIVRRHYVSLSEKLKSLNKLLAPALPKKTVPIIPLDPHKPTAVIFIGEQRSVAMHTLLWVLRMFPNRFHNLIFVSVGVVDMESYTGKKSLKRMQEKVEDNLDYFITYCQQHELAATKYTDYGTDIIDRLMHIVDKISEEYPDCIYFASQLIFEKETWILRALHNETPLTLQRRLHNMGKQLIILPMKI